MSYILSTRGIERIAIALMAIGFLYFALVERLL